MKIDRAAVQLLQKALTGSAEELLAIIHQAPADFYQPYTKTRIWLKIIC